jgi:hypothetical protein
MDRKITATLEKLSKSLAAIAEGMTQLQLDIAKMDARLVAVDAQVASINRHLGRENGTGEDESRRDLELEREVFGNMTARPSSRSPKAKQTKKPRKLPAKRRR